MKASNRILIGVFVALAVSAFGISAQEEPSISFSELQRYIDFTSSLKEINELVESGAAIPGDRYYLLTGTINGISVVDPDPIEYWAEADFISAEWVSSETIKTYKAHLVFLDGRFAERLYNRLPRDAGPEVIRNNSKGLVIVEFYDVLELPSGEALPFFIVLDYKSLE